MEETWWLEMGLFFYFVLFVVTCLFGLWCKASG
jgi:hypothetical protein